MQAIPDEERPRARSKKGARLLRSLTTDMKQPVPVERIIRQPNSEVDCALYALLNLYVWAGIEPPPVEAAQAARRKVEGDTPDPRGPVIW